MAGFYLIGVSIVGLALTLVLYFSACIYQYVQLRLSKSGLGFIPPAFWQPLLFSHSIVHIAIESMSYSKSILLFGSNSNFDYGFVIRNILIIVSITYLVLLVAFTMRKKRSKLNE